MLSRVNKITYQYIFVILSIFIVFVSIPFSSNIPHFWNDFNFGEFAHNQNLFKNLLEVLPNSKNINGIGVWILEPSLNFLSQFNYNVSNKYDYYKYLGIFRVLEISLLFFSLYSFKEKINLSNLILIQFLYIIFLVNFNRYDHDSYINFAIIIFCIFHLLAFRIKNIYLFFAANFVGNLWAYLMNPIYFFIICFGPLIFFYSYYILIKNLKNF